MKRPTQHRLFTLILALLLACTACFTVFAENAGNSDFEIKGNTLVKYNGDGGEVTVPEGIVKLADGAFDNSEVTKVNLPEGLKTIGNHCFFNCYELEEITLPASLKGLENMTQAFGYNSALKEFKVAEGSKNYKTVDGVLFTADGKKLVYYPDGKEDKAYAIPEGTRGFGKSPFQSARFETVSIPSTLVDMKDEYTIFTGLRALSEINVSPENKKYYSEGGVLYTGKRLVAYPAQKNLTSLKPTDFPAGLQEIGNNAFWGNGSLESVEFPESVTAVGGKAFVNVTKLKTVVIPASVKKIGFLAFAGCRNLERVTVLNPNVRIEGGYGNNDPKLYNLLCWDDTTKAALCGYPGGKLEAYAEKCGLKFEFLDPETGKVIEISPDFEIQGRTLVKYHGAGGEVTVPKIIEKLGEWAFEGSHVTKVNLPESLKEIGSYCFMDCKELTDITLPASLQKLGEAQVFAFNSSLKEIKVAEGNKKFKAVDGVLFSANGQELLYYPDGKTGSYVIPEGTRKLGYTAFGKPDMPSITIPASLGKVSGGDFSGILLKSFRVSEKCRAYHTVDGVLYDRSHNLIAYPGAKGKTELKPEDFEQGITQVTNWAFQDNKHLKKVEFPEGLKKIGWMSFTWSENLEEVIVPASVNSIDQYIFSFSPNLKKVTVLNKNVRFAADRKDQDPLEHHIFRYCENAVLCGYAGSTAEKYAETHGLKFEVLEEEKK